ncbi:MAG: TonB-dependent receptor, partial [Hymenobacter sp.]
MSHPVRTSFRISSLLLLQVLVSYAALAQQLSSTLVGIVQDSVSRQPVAYATVVLLPSSPGGSQLAGSMTDGQGSFALTKLLLGSFRLRVSLVGYATHTQAVVVTSATTTLPTILLAPATQQLGEAVVVGRQPLVEVQPDRLVYNAAQDIGNAGGTATDVLRKTPLLAVDGAGNVTLCGSANFRVLVNNHPSPALAQNLTQALKGFSADQIQSVEVITTPSARDDGEGTAGVINIVLKKGVRRQVNGHVGASAGNRATELTSALGFRRGLVSVNAAASTGTWYEPDQLTRRRLGFSALGTDTLMQSGRRLNSGQWYNATLNLDYDPAEHHRFALTGTLSGYQGQGQRDLFNQLVSPDKTLNQLFTRANTEYVG